MSGALTKILPRQCGGNTRGLLYIGKKGSEMKRQQAAGEKSGGFTNEQFPQGGLAGPKVKVPAIPRVWVGAVFTNDYCIILYSLKSKLTVTSG